MALALERSSTDDARTLDESLGRPLEAGDVRRLQAVIESSGAVAEVESRIERLTEQALAALGDPAVRPEARPGLRALADAAVRRTG